jgi:ABC-type phosphate transport system substrate-binding protein
MPEIWLRYGTTDVVLDIRFENLANQISSSFQALAEEEVKAAIGGVPVTDNMLVLALSASKATAKAAAMLAEAARAKGFANVTVDVPGRMAGALRTNLTAAAGGELVSINRIDYQSPLQERISKFQSAVVVSSVAYDPLFGFAGAPTALVRNLLADQMAEAFKARQGNWPAPGIESGPLKVAISSIEGIPATSIELVANSEGIAGVHTGSIAEAFDKAVSQLKSESEVEADPVKCAIISASSEAGSHSTLASALNSLWNSVHIVREDGSAILLAENREGVGGGALQMFIEGRLKPEQLQASPYIDGLEHLLYIEELRQKYELGLVSTLPHYYARTKLGFATYAGMKDILDKLPDRHGKSYKALVLSDADITLLKERT